jgi:hypothetical protein
MFARFKRKLELLVLTLSTKLQGGLRGPSFVRVPPTAPAPPGVRAANASGERAREFVVVVGSRLASVVG